MPDAQPDGQLDSANQLDTAEAIDADAPDPTPAEITDPAHPDHVDPYTDATPIGDPA